MGIQHAQRAVVKRITCTVTEDRYRESVHQISGLYKHAQQQLNGIECMCMSQCL